MVTVLILISAFASVLAGLLGGSRVPYHAARDGVFCSAFGRLHLRGDVPYVALTVLRPRQPGLRRPYRQWLYPLPSLAALAGWSYVYSSAGRVPIELSVAWVATGILAFLVWARVTRARPFGPKRFREEYLTTQP